MRAYEIGNGQLFQPTTALRLSRWAPTYIGSNLGPICIAKIILNRRKSTILMVNDLSSNVSLSRQRSRVRVSSSPPAFSDPYKFHPKKSLGPVRVQLIIGPRVESILDAGFRSAEWPLPACSGRESERHKQGIFRRRRRASVAATQIVADGELVLAHFGEGMVPNEC
jgi:hypothetical protein